MLGVADPHPGPVHRRVEPRAVAEGGRVAAGVAAARHQREPPHAARHAGVDWARGRGLVLGAEEAAAEPVVAVPHPALLHAVLPAGDQEVVRGAVGVTCLNSALYRHTHQPYPYQIICSVLLRWVDHTSYEFVC